MPKNTPASVARTASLLRLRWLAILSAQQAYHRKNDWAQRTGTAVLLANEIRELTLTLPQHDPYSPTHMGPETGETSVALYDDLDDFAGPVTAGYGAGVTFDGPINALRQPITNMTGWRQVVKVENVLADNISSTFTQPLGTTESRMAVTSENVCVRLALWVPALL